jgi:aspartate racemase
MKTIGIIAGAGPFAGLDLLKKLFEQTLADGDAGHLNVIGWFASSQLPDRTAYLLDSSKPNPGYAMAAQTLALEKSGAQLAAIPCNTAHAPVIFDCMRAELKAAGSQVQFLNMLQETMDHIRRHHGDLQRIGVLSTTGTWRVKLYPFYLEQAGFQAVTPDEDVQLKLVHPAIYDAVYGIKAVGAGTPRSRAGLLSAAQHLVDKGAQAVILGCTELPLALPEKRAGDAILLDPALILARALILEAAPEKLRPYTPHP